MDEASLCEKIALIQEGKILRIDTPDQVVQTYNKPLFAVRSNDFYRLLMDLRKHEKTERAEAFGEYLHLTTDKSFAESEIKAYLENKGHRDVKLHTIQASIEDVFLDLMQSENL
jgi:ABC-type multidrug transport system ATPase subunit